MEVKTFDYSLEDKYIAQSPADRREESKLMVIHREENKRTHEHFYNIPSYLKAGDCLVLNNSKVLPARFFGKKAETGGKVELLLTKHKGGDLWESMARPGKRVKPGDVIELGADFSAKIMDYSEDGTRIIEFSYKGEFMESLEKYGKMPLPPYIQRDTEEEDKDRYQTVYCEKEGSVAAPTAGLHFTKEILKEIEEKGIKVVYVTLHVGIGTFRPVSVDTVEDHHMHFEEYYIDKDSAKIINDTKEKGGRVIAVGTTSTRTLESAARDGRVKSGSGETDIFIYPGYSFQIIDGLLTNFHLPKSTLMMLISAFYNREKIMEAYEDAKAQDYRFFSYGDAMLLI